MTESEIEQLVASWRGLTLPFARWRHAEHLIVALWHVRRHPPEEALRQVREGIQRFNLHNGVEQTPEGGYHETLTRVWMHKVGALNAAHPELGEAELARLVCQLCLDQKQEILRHYTRERIMSWEARTGWVEPDREPL